MGFDFERLRGRRVIAINRSFRSAPWADVLYFCDGYWWTGVDSPEARRTFEGKYIVTIAKGVRDPIVKVLGNSGRHELSRDPSVLGHGTNSGFQAINLAYHFGVSRIILLGFDMKIAPGLTHHHGGYGAPEAIVSHALTKQMLPRFDALVGPLALAGIEVLNACPDSALECWSRVSREFALGSAVCR